MTDEAEFMYRAIELAERGRHRVMPNPLVGCVLVRNGEIIAEGWHDHLGGLHAEQMAIADAEARGVETHGATAYVTLEPCNHFGRTPPCTEALMWAGVKKVVVGSPDPNPTVRGDGSEVLRNAGIDVTTGLLQDRCEEQMSQFMHWCQHRQPEVLLKAAVDKNGKIDSDSAEATRFSSPESLKLVHELRADSMAIIVGVNTVIRDDPSLTVRGSDVEPRKQPIRIVIDPNGRAPKNCKLMQDGLAPTLLIHIKEISTDDDAEHVQRVVLSDDDGELDPQRILYMLGDREIQSLLLEGGADTWQRFLDAGAVDRAHLCQSPVSLPGNDGPFFGSENLENAGLTRQSTEMVGGDSISKWKRL